MEVIIGGEVPGIEFVFGGGDPSLDLLNLEAVLFVVQCKAYMAAG